MAQPDVRVERRGGDLAIARGVHGEILGAVMLFGHPGGFSPLALEHFRALVATALESPARRAGIEGRR